MSNKYLDLTGLSYFKDKNDEEYKVYTLCVPVDGALSGTLTSLTAQTQYSKLYPWGENPTVGDTITVTIILHCTDGIRIFAKTKATVDSVDASFTVTVLNTVSAYIDTDSSVYGLVDADSGDSGSTDTYDSVLNNNTWAQISAASSAGVASSLWSVGDTKAVTLSGTVGTLAVDTTLYAFILGFNHNADLEGNNLIHFGTFMSAQEGGTDVALIDDNLYDDSTGGDLWFNMNHWGYRNYGGWGASDIRYDILGSTDVKPSVYGAIKTSGCTGYDASSTCATSPVSNTFMSALPSALRAVMKPITKYTDNVGGGTGSKSSNISGLVDYLPLLSPYEVFGYTDWANFYEGGYQQQYDYYANGNDCIKYCYNDTDCPVWWWLRSPYYDDYHFFCYVGEDGIEDWDRAYFSYGLAPLFAV